MSSKQIINRVLVLLIFTIVITGCAAEPKTTLIPTTNAVTATVTAPVQVFTTQQPAQPEPTFDITSTVEEVAETAQPQEDTLVLFEKKEPAVDTTTPTPDTRPLPKYWAEWPIVPEVSQHAREIFALGQELGNDPHVFSVIGDCQSEPAVLMGTYDSSKYLLGDGYEYLEDTIHWFKGSFDRDNITVKDGMSVASVLNPLWADPSQCESNETPLDCEIRIHKPSIMIISLGTNWNGGNEQTHEKFMRQIVDILISRGIVPILSSKGDNLEGDHRINQSIARVAYDYDIPFWNFWRSIRDLPGKGIDGTREGGYLTTEAWGRRSFSGLMALDAVWRALMK